MLWLIEPVLKQIKQRVACHGENRDSSKPASSIAWGSIYFCG
jgi:hypothetical protein